MLLVLFFAVIEIIVIHIESRDDEFYVGSWIMGVVFGITLFCIPVSHVIITGKIAEFESKRETIEYQRKRIDTEYERAMLTEEIVKANGWVTLIQKHKSMVLVDWYIPNKILDVEPIQ